MSIPICWVFANYLISFVNDFFATVIRPLARLDFPENVQLFFNLYEAHNCLFRNRDFLDILKLGSIPQPIMHDVQFLDTTELYDNALPDGILVRALALLAKLNRPPVSVFG